MEEDHLAERYLHSVHCVGRPDDTVEVSVFDADGNELPSGEIGEIAVRGLGIMSGYCNFQENTIKSVGEWFFTGT